VSTPDLDHLARLAYESYRKAARRDDLPQWDDTPERERYGWQVAVSAVTGKGDVTLTEGAPTQSLIVQVGGDTHVLHGDTTVGRQGNLKITDDHASGHHALLQAAHGLWYVEDLDSTNGTYLNNRRIFASQRLKKGDKIRIGHTVLLVVSA
jgi:pSer/pThr/pTyr-binding forkhead associated (FHA) protein